MVDYSSNTPIVFLHGWGSTSCIWQIQMIYFSSQYPVFAPDYLISCSEDQPIMVKSPLTLVTLAKGLFNLCQQNKLSSIHLVGWSLGGMIALEFAGRFPSLLKSLTLVSSTPKFVMDKDFPYALPGSELRLLKKRLMKDKLSAFASFHQLLFAEKEKDRQNILKIRDLLKPNKNISDSALSEGLDILETLDLRANLSSLELPVLIIHGQADRLCPIGAGEYLHQHLPQSKMVILPDCGHIPFLTRTGEFDKILEGFLKSCSSDNAAVGSGQAAGDTEQVNGRELAMEAAKTFLDKHNKVNKKKLQKNFSTSAPCYDRLSKLQAETGERLVSFLNIPALTIIPGPKKLPDDCGFTPNHALILDIGTGTGRLLQKIIPFFQGAEFHGCDLALGMVKQAKSTDLNSACLIQADAEYLPYRLEGFDLILSNLTYQWVANLEQAFYEVFRLLKPKGIFCFSTLIEGSLAELEHSFKKAYQEYPSLAMKRHSLGFSKPQVIIKILQEIGFSNLQTQEFIIKHKYPTVRSFLLSLKSIGASNASMDCSAGLGGRGILNKMIHHYQKNFGTEDGIGVSYQLLLVQGKKS